MIPLSDACEYKETHVPCLVVLLALLLPRLAMVLIFLLSDWFSAVFAGPLLPILGFLLFPYTTLAYMAAILNAHGVHGLWWVLLIVAFLADLGHWGTGHRHVGRRRRA
jgi:hypothetical protein